MTSSASASRAGVGDLAGRLRLASGIVVFVFLLTHLLNHALGAHSLLAAERGRDLFVAVWRSWPGTILLYGALATHLVLVLVSVARLRTVRLPLWQVAQLTLGLAIPALLIGHVFGTRIAHEVLGITDDYARVLRVLWPDLAINQTLLVLLAWGHGVIGIHYWLRLKSWYRRLRPVMALAAVLLPVMALLGFALAGREVEILDRTGYAALDDGAGVRDLAAAEQAAAVRLWAAEQATKVALLAAVLLALLIPIGRHVLSRFRDDLAISYPTGDVVPIAPGMSVLEASRSAGIPHAAVCGGRGRCSTCRIRIGRGDARAPEPAAEEHRVLQRIGAGPEIRLACQFRPRSPVSVIPLLDARVGPESAQAPLDPAQGVEREMAILFADLRNYTRFAEGRLPYDTVFILNQWFSMVGEAIESRGGHVDKFIGDGVMALFGIDTTPEEACRQAVAAASAVAEALARLNERLAQDIAEPLRIAIGVHAGPVILGEMGYRDATSLTAIGDAVNVASRLELLAKQADVQLVLSASLVQAAGLSGGVGEAREIEIRGRRRPLAVLLVDDATHLPPVAPRPGAAGDRVAGSVARLRRAAAALLPARTGG